MSIRRKLLGLDKRVFQKPDVGTSHITYTRGDRVVDETYKIFYDNNFGWVSVFADEETGVAFFNKFYNDRLPFFCNLIWLHHDRKRPALLIEEGFELFNPRERMKYHIWEYNSSQTKTISMSRSFTKPFKSIITGVCALIDEEWYHGNLLNGITVSKDLDVKLCNVSKQDLGLEAGIQKDLDDIRSLVELVINHNPMSDASFDLPDFVSLYYNFPIMFKDIHLDSSIQVNRTKFAAYFELNSPIFLGETDRLILTKKFIGLRESFTNEIDTKLKLETYPADIIDWWMRMPPRSYAYDRLNHDLRVYLTGKEDVLQKTIIGFYRVCFYHKKNSRFPIDDLAILAGLTEIYPDFLAKVYYEFVRNVTWQELNCTRYGSYIEFFQNDMPEIP